MRVRRSAAVTVAIIALVLPACTPDGEPVDETEVRGVQIERDEPEARATAAPEEDADEGATPRPRPRIRTRPVEDPEPTPEPTPRATEEPAPAPAPAPPPAAQPTPDSGEGSTDTSSTTVERPEPTASPAEPLESGAGWGYATLHPHEDGSGWTETSSTPPVDRTGDDGHRSFTTVASSPVEGAPSQLDVGCPAWLSAPPDSGLRGRGTVIAELLAGDAVLASAVHDVEIDLAPDERSQDLAWGAPIRVDAGDGATVTCRVRVEV